MQRSLLAAATLAFASFAVACGPDLTPGPTGPEFARSGGTLGNPKFASKPTSCSPATLSAGSSGELTCAYTINGLGNTDRVDVTLSAPAVFDGQCRNNGGQIVEVKDFYRSESTTDFDVEIDNGSASGTITMSLPSAGPSSGDVCPNGNWKVEGSWQWAGGFELYGVAFSPPGNAVGLRFNSEYTL